MISTFLYKVQQGCHCVFWPSSAMCIPMYRNFLTIKAVHILSQYVKSSTIFCIFSFFRLLFLEPAGRFLQIRFLLVPERVRGWKLPSQPVPAVAGLQRRCAERWPAPEPSFFAAAAGRVLRPNQADRHQARSELQHRGAEAVPAGHRRAHPYRATMSVL